MKVDSVGIIAIVSMSYYHTHSKNIDKRGKNPQSARRKPNYHTKCGKNCYLNVILSNRYLAERHFPDTSFSQKSFSRIII